MKHARSLIRGILYTLLLLAIFGVGYYMGTRSNHLAPMSEAKARETIQTLWVQAEEPPEPQVSIEGKNIELQRSNYSWCFRDRCATTDAARPTIDDLTPVPAKAGAEISTTPPQGIKSFDIRNLTQSEHDGYSVPTSPGLYLYEIRCTWLWEQGEAYYYFAVTAE